MFLEPEPEPCHIGKQVVPNTLRRGRHENQSSFFSYDDTKIKGFENELPSIRHEK